MVTDQQPAPQAEDDSRGEAFTVIRVLGAFEVYRDGVPVAVPHGLPRRAIKFVVARGGGVHVEVLADELWPEAGPAEQQKGVRNILARLGRADTALMVRDGETVRLAPGIVVDSFSFRAAADRVLLAARTPEAVEAAYAAVGKYGGDFLPDDLYTEWTERVREQLRRRYVALLDLLANDAQRRGALTEAAHLLETAIEIDPSDDIRYLEAAEVHLADGRRGRAAALVQRSRDVLAELGLEPGAGWHRVDAALRADEPEAAMSRP